MDILSTKPPPQKSEQGLTFSPFQNLPPELRLKIWRMAMRAHVRIITIRVYFFSGYSRPRHVTWSNFEEDNEAMQAVVLRRKKLFEFDDDALEPILKTRTLQELEDDGVYVELQATSNSVSESCHESRQAWLEWCTGHENKPIRHLFNPVNGFPADGIPAYNVTPNVYVAPYDILLLERGNVRIHETFSVIAPFLAKTQRLAIAHEYTYDWPIIDFFPSGLKALVLVWGKNPNRSPTRYLKQLKDLTASGSRLDHPGREDMRSMKRLLKHWGRIVGSNVPLRLAVRKLIKEEKIIVE